MIRHITTHRIFGAPILLLVTTFLLGMLRGAGGPGLDTRSEYFYGDGPNSWRYLASQHRAQATEGLVPLIVAGAAAIATAALVRPAFRPHPTELATASAIGLLSAGVLILVFQFMSFRVADLANQWTASVEGLQADGILDSAFSAVTIRFLAAGLGIPLLLGSLIAVGLAIQKRGRLPRWLVALPWLGGAVLIASPMGFFIGTGFFSIVALSAIILFLWIVILAVSLLVPGPTQT